MSGACGDILKSSFILILLNFLVMVPLIVLSSISLYDIREHYNTPKSYANWKNEIIQDFISINSNDNCSNY
jgi:hypothetical protein